MGQQSRMIMPEFFRDAPRVLGVPFVSDASQDPLLTEQNATGGQYMDQVWMFSRNRKNGFHRQQCRLWMDGRTVKLKYLAGKIT